MISIQSKFASFPQGLCEFQGSKDGRYGWFLCTMHEEENEALEEIQAQIKLDILNSDVLEISKIQIENWLTSFFEDFHWKLHASLRMTNLREKGISLFFAVTYDSEIYFVQFGRIFCGLNRGKKMLFPGMPWKNFHIRSHREMNLLGLAEEDIKVRPVRVRLAENETLYVLSGGMAAEVFGSGTDLKGMLALIESYGSSGNAVWLVLKNQPQLQKLKKRRLNKLQITSLILLLGTILAIVYMAFGNRILDVILHRTKKDVSAWQMSTVSSEVITNLGKVLNFPARSIELNIGWSAELPYNITSAPAFDQGKIYLANSNNLLVYGKKNRELLWEGSYGAPISGILPTGAGLELCLQNDHLIGLDREGNEIWRKSLENGISGNNGSRMMEITNNEDKRIDRGITVVPMQKGVAVLDSQSGETISELQLNERLRYLSSYDDYDMCFYAVIENSLVCIELRIVN
jgi:hypothetical protein